MVDWDDLRLFMAVARAGSLSAAAPRVKVDPATLSRRIARLERRMARVLFAKGPQGYVLTDEGQHLLDHVARAEEALTPALAAPTGEGFAGHLRVGAPDGCANFVLPRVCADLQAANPGLEIQILALPRVVSLSRREADLAITVSPPDAGRRLHVEPITDYHLHLAAHRDVADAIHTPGDLTAHPLIGYIPEMIYDPELDYLGDLSRDGVQLASNSVSVQLQLLRAGRGVGVVHDFALPSAPELRRILIQVLSLKRTFYLVQQKGDRTSARMRALADALCAGMRAEVHRLESELLTD